MHNTNRACFTCGELTTAGNLFCSAHLLKWHPRAGDPEIERTYLAPHPSPIYRPF